MVYDKLVSNDNVCKDKRCATKMRRQKRGNRMRTDGLIGEHTYAETMQIIIDNYGLYSHFGIKIPGGRSVRLCAIFFAFGRARTRTVNINLI